MDGNTAHTIFTLVLTGLLIAWLLGQVRKPSGPLGRRLVQTMNLSHASMTDWALEHIHVKPDAAILDVGCGGGRTIQRLAALAPDGVVHGIDYSPASVAASRATNAGGIAAGHVQVQLGSVSSLPYPDGSFDLVTAVETHYYWPDLPASMREVLRVLKPGGEFALVAETYRGGRFGAVYGVAMRLIRAVYLTDEEHRNLLTEAGFTEVTTMHAPGKSWICAVGRRPGATV